MKNTLKNIVIGATIAGAYAALIIGGPIAKDFISASYTKKAEKIYDYNHIGEYKGYVLCGPEVFDVDKDGKVDIMINPPRKNIMGLDFYLETTGTKYKKAIVKSGYLPQYGGENVEVVSKEFFDEMFPVRKQQVQ